MKWVGFAVILAPVAIAMTIAALPLWAWIEDTYAIESIGHHGPAGWCYVATYALSFLAAVALNKLRLRKRH